MKQRARDEIRREMMKDIKTGGIRAKYCWLKRFFNNGESQIGVLKYFGIALTGFMGLASLDFSSLLYFGVTYVIASTIIGFMYNWYQLSIIDNYITNILDPFAHEVKKKLGI